MTAREYQKTKEQPPEQRDDLALDPGTVNDLEPPVNANIRVRGGAAANHGGAAPSGARTMVQGCAG